MLILGGISPEPVQGPGCEKKWYGTHVNKPNGEWTGVAENMLVNFAESGHPIFQSTSPLGRRELKSKGGGKKTIHYNGSEKTVELILRTVVSFNQLSVCGAVADLCNELDPDYAESVICESLVIPSESADADATSQSSSSSAQGTCCKIMSSNSQNFLKMRNCRNFAMMLVSQRRLRKDSSSSQLRKDLRLCRQHVENTLILETSQHPDREGGFVQIRRSAQSWM